MYEHNAVLLIGAFALVIIAIALAFLPKRIAAKYPNVAPKTMRWLSNSSQSLGFVVWCVALLIFVIQIMWAAYRASV